ncbi:MAG TPA: alpha/beta hydrolase, partial [Arthrobacter sp.]|nr:alpha/beta hydrolase [Arthrobacter sp.]
HGSSIVRNATASLVEPLARVRPKARLKLPEFGLYWRSLSNQADGEWELNSDWRWEYGFPIRAGWLRAVLAGHSQIAAGLTIDVPVLVLISARSVVSPTWTEDAMQTDIVLDVEQIALRAPGLGCRVTIVRTEGALHDVLLSSRSVRRQVYQDLEQWARCYLLGT